MIYVEINKNSFRDAFTRMGRKDQFSASAFDTIFYHLVDISEDSTIELDVIAICCDFSEYSLSEALKDFDCETIEQLRDEMLVLEVDSETVVVGS